GENGKGILTKSLSGACQRGAALMLPDGGLQVRESAPDGRVKKALHSAHDTQHARPRDQPLPSAAQGQSGSLAALGRGGVRSRQASRQADPSLDRLRRVSLVPRDGGGELRQPGN